MSSTPMALGPVPLRLVQAAVVLLIALKAAQLAFAGVFMDESYYWMWGQHPALSYYDHPPLNAWLLSLSSSVFGWNVLALRLPIAVLFVADIGAIRLLSRTLGGAARRDHFWVTLLLFLVTPMFWIVTSYALPDHVLLTCLLYALAFLQRFFSARAAGEPGRDRDLYLGALALGLAGLAKYNAAFLGVALAVHIVLFHRPLLRQARLYVATALTLVLQTPVVMWNISKQFASFEFILHGRHTGLSASMDGVLQLTLGIVLFISPFLFWPIVQFALARRNAVLAMGLARAAFLISTLSIVAVSFTTAVLFHWNLIAYAAMLPFLAFFMRPRFLLVLQALYGVFFAVVALVNYSIVPLTDVDGWQDEASAWSYGWGPTAQAVETLRHDNKIGFVATADYTTASLLAFALKDKDVVSLSPNRDAYDDWFVPAAHAGENAILFGDRYRSLNPAITDRFERVTELVALPVIVHGRALDTHRLYLAEGFKPGG